MSCPLVARRVNGRVHVATNGLAHNRSGSWSMTDEEARVFAAALLVAANVDASTVLEGAELAQTGLDFYQKLKKLTGRG